MTNLIPEGWSKSKLGEVAKLTMGQSPASDTYNTDSDGLPFFQGKADFGSRYPKVRYWCAEPSKIADKQSILFSVRAPVGEVNITPYECCIGRGLAGIQGEAADQEFLFQKLQYVKPRFQLLSQGSTFEAINGSEMREFDLTLPPLPEQQKIATILSSVDDVIEKIRAQIDKLKDLKTGMMQELLTKGIGHTEFKDSPVGRIPRAWDVVALEDLCSKVTVGIASSTTHAYSEYGVPLLRNQNILPNAIRRTDMLYISEAFSEEHASKKVRTGDVVTVRTGYPGISAVVPPEFNNSHTFTTLISRPKSSRLNSYYLALLINSDYGKNFVVGGQAGGAQQNLNATTLKMFPVILPSIEEQVAIFQVVDSISQKVLLAQKKLSLMGETKKALMQDLLTGKVRVKLTDKESAAS